VGIEAAEDTLFVTATAADLPPAVAHALAAERLAEAPPGEPGGVESGGLRWATRTWGAPGDPPLLLVHGVTSDAGTFWRLGPALAAAGLRVVAVDLPGHGGTGHWQGHHRFGETSRELAAFIRAAELDVPDIAVLGHSWGGMIVAGLPAAGIRPRTLILLDPPHLTLERLRALTESPTEQLYATPEAARAAIRAENPTWTEGDVDAKAAGLTRFSPEGVLTVLLENGPWDAGLAALADPAGAGIPTWYVIGEWHAGGLIPGHAVSRLAARVGADHVLTVAGGPHSPQRTHPEATALAILHALGADGTREPGG
jgi:pimeloyl-ACP methyl ester carboxylesterase